MSCLVQDVRGSLVTGPARGRTRPLPTLRRDGIRWTGGAGGLPLALDLTFENPFRVPSAPTTARVEVAAFGAFVPSTPLARVAVPAIPPGGRRRVTGTAAAGAPLPPPPRRRRSLSTARSAMRALLHLTSDTPSVHFVGNLNVFVTRGRPVERHLERSVALCSGRPNFAMFFVGDRKPDVYDFSVGSVERGWEVALAGVAWGAPVSISFSTVMLSISPPPKAGSGGVSVLVHRHSTDETVPVEFELDAAPAKSRCYFF